MKRSMSRQAEAERERRRARVISADGEYQASKEAAQAATIMSADPAALASSAGDSAQTVVEVAAETDQHRSSRCPSRCSRTAALLRPRCPARRPGPGRLAAEGAPGTCQPAGRATRERAPDQGHDHPGRGDIIRARSKPCCSPSPQPCRRRPLSASNQSGGPGARAHDPRQAATAPRAISGGPGSAGQTRVRARRDAVRQDPEVQAAGELHPGAAVGMTWADGTT